MREKYVEERFPPWMLCGYYGLRESPDHNVTDVNDSFNWRMSEELALDVTNRHNKLLHFLALLADAFDKADHEAFSKFWYETSREN